MSDKIEFNISPETTGTGVIKTGNLEPRDYTQYEDILQKADRFDGTNVRGRLRLNDNNFYNFRKYYRMKKKELDENKSSLAEEMLSFAYAHQIQAVETLLKLPSGGLLADQVGMGKTIEAGMLISELAYRDEWRTLIITLSNDDLIRNWHDEMFEKFGLNLAIVKGKTNDDYQTVFDILCEYQRTGVIKNYKGETNETISRVTYDFGGALVPFSYLVDERFIKLVENYNLENPESPFHIDMIVVDESHRYTSNDAAGSNNKIQALHHLQMKQKVKFNGEERTQKLGRILLLTATPIKNDLNELLELMQIIDPKYTIDDFREELGLSKDDPFDLTTVLEKKRGVNRWWEWFSKFGERHTRITTMYDKDKRKYGVHWKPKNSHSFYFNDIVNYPIRPYFDDSDVKNNYIKRVSGEPILKERMESKIMGKRDAFIENYSSDVKSLNMEKFNRILSCIKYIKHEISKDELRQIEFDEKVDGITFASFIRILDKKDFDEWRTFSDSYSSLKNEEEEIRKKKIIEKATSKFLENLSFQEYGDNSQFIDDFFKFLNSRLKDQQKDRNGISRIKSYDKLAMILCSDNLFLQIEKMRVLGEIINSPKHSNEKVIIFCKDDAERRMLVENSHLWDFKNRYMDNDSVSKIAKLSSSDVAYSKFMNVVSIAYTTDAEGLNLQSYHTMINYSIVLSPLHMEQRIGRIDRIGQKNEMDVYFLANAQDVEGYVLRFFEYELELFSNWSGDTTASTYFDATENGEEVKKEFDTISVEIWNNVNELSMDKDSKINAFEFSIAKVFNNVRERVIKIAKYSKDIEDMKIVVEEINQDDMEMYFDDAMFF